jgi:hypothetical protein
MYWQQPCFEDRIICLHEICMSLGRTGDEILTGLTKNKGAPYREGRHVREKWKEIENFFRVLR